MVSEYMQLFLTNIQSLLLYLNDYLTPIGCITLAIIFLLILISLKLSSSHSSTNTKNNSVKIPKQSNHVITSNDIKAIAGEDVLSTQLDLARAYVEMDKKNLAKKILNHVMQHGNTMQQQEAKQLLAGI